MVAIDPRNRSRTDPGRRAKAVMKHTAPPSDQGGWMGLSRDLLESEAWSSMSHNAWKFMNRVLIEHIGHHRLKNGELIVTHSDFIKYGVTAEYVGDAADELDFRGLLRINRGRAGNGTAHPNIYRLTFDGDYEGGKATNEWRRFTANDAKRWNETERERCRLSRAKVGRKAKTPLRVSEIRPLRVSEIRRVG